MSSALPGYLRSIKQTWRKGGKFISLPYAKLWSEMNLGSRSKIKSTAGCCICNSLFALSCWCTGSGGHLIRLHFCPGDSEAWAPKWQPWQQGFLPEKLSSNSSRAQLQPETFQHGSTFRPGSVWRFDLAKVPEITSWEFTGNQDFPFHLNQRVSLAQATARNIRLNNGQKANK